MKSQNKQAEVSNTKSLMVYSFIISMQILSTVACAPRDNSQVSQELSGETIVAGTVVTDKDPITDSTVAIIIETPQGEGLCTGTLIDKNVVLTAGHCFADGATRAAVVFGTNVDSSKSVLPVDRVIVHPQYGERDPGAGGWNDLTVLHFAGDAPATAKVAEVLKDSTLLKKGLQGVAAGFGSTPKNGMGSDSGLLRKVTLTLQDPVFEKTELLFPLSPKGGSTCHGDSGGPIYVLQKGKPVLIGVTSRGTSSACDNVSIFTNVSSHTAFINDSIKSLLAPKP